MWRVYFLVNSWASMDVPVRVRARYYSLMLVVDPMRLLPSPTSPRCWHRYRRYRQSIPAVRTLYCLRLYDCYRRGDRCPRPSRTSDFSPLKNRSALRRYCSTVASDRVVSWSSPRVNPASASRSYEFVLGVTIVGPLWASVSPVSVVSHPSGNPHRPAYHAVVNG